MAFIKVPNRKRIKMYYQGGYRERDIMRNSKFAIKKNRRCAIAASYVRPLPPQSWQYVEDLGEVK